MARPVVLGWAKAQSQAPGAATGPEPQRACALGPRKLAVSRGTGLLYSERPRDARSGHSTSTRQNLFFWGRRPGADPHDQAHMDLARNARRSGQTSRPMLLAGTNKSCHRTVGEDGVAAGDPDDEDLQTWYRYFPNRYCTSRRGYCLPAASFLG